MNMNNKAIIPIAAACVLLVVCAVVQAFWSDRWFPVPESKQVQTFVDRLKSSPGLPMVIGDWDGKAQEMDARERDVAGIRGYISRVYKNRVTGEEVSMMLVCGSFRHIAKHSPEMCYRAQGFAQADAMETREIATSSETAGDFKTTVFKKEDSEKGLQKLRIFWTWNYDGQWVAPSNARWSLRGRPALYKMYLISHVPRYDSKLADKSPCIKFARALLPLLDPMLFPPELNQETAGTTAQAALQ